MVIDSNFIVEITKYNRIIVFSDEVDIGFTDIDFFKNESVKIVTSGTNEYDLILKLYRMYDFSDKVFFVSESKICGDIINFLKTDILSLNEVIEVILGFVE